MSVSSVQRHVDFISRYYPSLCECRVYFQRTGHWYELRGTCRTRRPLVAWNWIQRAHWSICRTWSIRCNRSPGQWRRNRTQGSACVVSQGAALVDHEHSGTLSIECRLVSSYNFMRLVWSILIFVAIVAKVGVSGKLHFNCFLSVFRNFEDTTKKSFFKVKSYPQREKRNFQLRLQGLVAFLRCISALWTTSIFPIWGSAWRIN